MKKILVLFNEKSQINLEGISTVAKENCFELYGIFLKHSKATDDFYYPFLSDLCSTRPSDYEKKLEQSSNKVIHHSIELINNECKLAGISFYPTIFENGSIDELINQTATADLLLLDNNLDLKEYFIESVNVGVKDLVSNIHCPVNLSARQIPAK